MAGTNWSDLLGTVRDFFRIGVAGPRLKSSSGNLLVRNSADSADVEVTASKVKISGDILELNSDAAGAGADWKMILQRPVAGMTGLITFTLPVDDGTPGQVLQTDGNGVLSWVAAGAAANADKVDTTALAFGTASPLTLFSTGAADIVYEAEVIVDTAFNGAPSLSIGISGSVAKYAATTDIDLTQVAGSVFKVHPGLGAQGVEALIGTYVAGGATVGAARILIHFVTPS